MTSIYVLNFLTKNHSISCDLVHLITELDL